MSLMERIRGRKEMTPVRRSIEDPIRSLRQEIDRTFEDFWTRWPSLPSLLSGEDDGYGSFMPRIDMIESAETIDVTAEIPGIAERDLDVTLSADGTALMIRGEKRHTEETKGRDYYRAERSFGSFRRTVSLPATVDADRVEATCKDGVLHLRLPKVPEETQGIKHIDVKSV